jgi:hypothetical protein
MEISIYPSIEVQIKLTGSEADRLTAAAARHGVSATDLIQRLIEVFLTSEEDADAIDWQALSLSTFEADWDNPEDAVYDQWREHYGVGSR